MSDAAPKPQPWTPATVIAPEPGAFDPVCTDDTRVEILVDAIQRDAAVLASSGAYGDAAPSLVRADPTLLRLMPAVLDRLADGDRLARRRAGNTYTIGTVISGDAGTLLEGLTVQAAKQWAADKEPPRGPDPRCERCNRPGPACANDPCWQRKPGEVANV
jgi:hypothetical protein